MGISLIKQVLITAIGDGRALRTAELDLKEAEPELSRRRIFAPISGWTGIITHNIGDQVTPSTEITQIDDRSEIVAEFRVPERFVGQIAVGELVVTEDVQNLRPGAEGEVKGDKAAGPAIAPTRG